MNTLDPTKMLPSERKATVWLGSLFALRMLGLFLVLPVFALHAKNLPGGDDALMLGLAFGAYGLTQGLLQIPFGAASDKFGRRPVLLIGLVIFCFGSVVAALSNTVLGLLIGRSLQGAGAISAVVTATLADSTRDSQRTKAMAVIGGCVAMSFAVSLVLAPALYGAISLEGIFWVTAALTVGGMLVVWKGLGKLPAPVAANVAPVSLKEIVLNPDLLRLNFGIFVLHAVQMAMFVQIPLWFFEHGNLDGAQHWKVYLPVVLASFVFMMPLLMWGEKKSKNKQAFVIAIGLLVMVELGFAALGFWDSMLKSNGLGLMAGLLLVFFIGFNVLEASLPSLVSRIAPPQAKGKALGVYNTTQALGLFAGPAIGGLLQKVLGEQAVFVACALALAIWCWVAPGLSRWPGRSIQKGSE